jgi:hypothetical protein
MRAAPKPEGKGVREVSERPDYAKIIAEDTATLKKMQEKGKPCYCLGLTTVRKVADEGAFNTEQVAFVAADDLFHTKLFTQRDLDLAVLEARIDAICIAKRTSFRPHADDDRDYHSGCEQTRDRIVEALQKWVDLQKQKAELEKAAQADTIPSSAQTDSTPA